MRPSGGHQHSAINRPIAQALNNVVHLSKGDAGNRFVDEVVRIKSYDPAADWFELEPLYAYF
jgi:hypothetical protein